MQYIGFGLLVLGACIGLFSARIQNLRWMKKLEKKMSKDEQSRREEEPQANSDERYEYETHDAANGIDGEPNDMEDFKMMYSGMSLSIKLAALVIAVFGFIAFFVFDK